MSRHSASPENTLLEVIKDAPYKTVRYIMRHLPRLLISLVGLPSLHSSIVPLSNLVPGFGIHYMCGDSGVFAPKRFIYCKVPNKLKYFATMKSTATRKVSDIHQYKLTKRIEYE